MNRQIQIILFAKDSSKSYVVDFTEDDTIASLKGKLLKKYDLKQDKLNLILCGKVLSEETTLKNLSLSPLTYLTATIPSSTSTNNPQCVPIRSESSEDSTENGSFHVFCKPCSSMRRGKLRVYCAVCKSSAIILDREPSRWSDVLQ
uniref:Ubiquitin-like domain-containing protein n=1 Tax=Acrobeloides nanus TaxID=290746 RepID=A0A914DFS8_9BILA